MAYFRGNETEATRRQPMKLPGEQPGGGTAEEYPEPDYDDGFDDPEEEEEELTEEEQQEIRMQRYQLTSSAGNLAAVIIGTVVILLLLALLMSMISFVMNDADRTFTLFQNRF